MIFGLILSHNPTSFILLVTHSNHVFLHLPLSTLSATSSMSAFLYPIILRLPLHMPEPSQSAMPYNITDEIKTDTTQQLLCLYCVFQSDATHPSHHHSFFLLLSSDATHIFYWKWVLLCKKTRHNSNAISAVKVSCGKNTV